MKSDETLFKCPNDLKINITKTNGEVVIDEECCTTVSIVLKNSGELATSFLGAHNPEIVKVLERATKLYFKSIRKTLKEAFKSEENPEDFTLLNEDLPEENKWDGQPVPDATSMSKAKSKDKTEGKSDIKKDSVSAKKITPKNKIAKK